jgi:hypothetical protein
MAWRASGSDVDGFEFRDVGEVLDDEGGGDAAEVEALAAGEDGGQDFFRFGGGEHEFGVGGRFFERFQEGVEGLLGEHVDFVDDVDLEPGGGGGVADGVAQLADFLDTAVAGAVDFDDVEGTAFGDFAAAGVVVLEIDLGTIGAIQALGEDAGDGGFAGAAGAAEEVGVGDAVLADGVGEGLGNVILADDVAEPLRSVFAGDDLVRHGVWKDDARQVLPAIHGFADDKRSQGDHGGCGANYRCCLPALAGFVCPHSVGPGKSRRLVKSAGWWSIKLNSGGSPKRPRRRVAGIDRRRGGFGRW